MLIFRKESNHLYDLQASQVIQYYGSSLFSMVFFSYILILYRFGKACVQWLVPLDTLGYRHMSTSQRIW